MKKDRFHAVMLRHGEKGINKTCTEFIEVSRFREPHDFAEHSFSLLLHSPATCDSKKLIRFDWAIRYISKTKPILIYWKAFFQLFSMKILLSFLFWNRSPEKSRNPLLGAIALWDIQGSCGKYQIRATL
jgi:hypothetical protein